MPGPQRSWNGTPFDAILSDNTNAWMQWVTSVLLQTQPQLFPMIAPTVTTIPQPGGVLVAWNEIQGANSYAIYESAVQATPPGLPVVTVPANHGAVSNSWLRSGLNDTVTRYYFVLGYDTSGNRGTLSTGKPGAALAAAAPITAISQNPVNQDSVGGGVGGGGGLAGSAVNRQPF